ncbi:protein moonraker isoform X3 [Alosa sapidissima]|uniref:protein moonraker isoform X3 n=1 Tax=Alosa sapidissima TaxID=34773 RepID=UPI001C099A75|nr:protein moonraker isoform X3 [Alosa sapidissima]
MTAKFQRVSFEDFSHLKGCWIPTGVGTTRSTQRPQTRLLFNEAIPLDPSNRETRVGPPAPIVIEKFVQRATELADGDSCGSSLRFSVLSEERLQTAVRLAKRDLRRRRQQSLINTPLTSSPCKQEHDSQDDSITDLQQQKKVTSKGQQTRNVQRSVTKSGAEVLVYTPQKLSVPTGSAYGQSPPTRDPGPKVGSKLSQEIRRLQKELGTCVQRIEQLTNKGPLMGEPLEPEEQRRMEIRRQEQAARSARIIYNLQQQVKDIQEDVEKLRSQNIKYTKKSRAMDRLTAAHRGAVRAMQVFTNQLSDPADCRVPPHYKELGQLIRQLSLCSAKVEAGQDSAIPETAIDILQKLETLDTALSKQQSPKRRELRTCSLSPIRLRSPVGRRHSISPPRSPRAPGPRKPPAQRKKPKGPPVSRRPRPAVQRPGGKARSAVLRAGLESLLQLRGHEEQAEQSRPQPPPPKPRASTSHQAAESNPDRSKQGGLPRESGFQQPTVSSRLKESQIPQKEAVVPWIPTSPRSPNKQRAVSKRPEPRCLFSTLRSSAGPPEQQGRGGPPEEPGPAGLGPERRQQAHQEALRQAWLDRITSERLQELEQLGHEEAERVQRLRSEVGSPTRWAERAEQAARERIEPLLERAQRLRDSWDKKGTSLQHRLSQQAADRTAASAELLSEALLEDLLEDTARSLQAVRTDRQAEEQARALVRAPTLDTMLRRMEEMEKDQEAVRRRFASIVYSDPLYWDKPEAESGDQRGGVVSRPLSPQPIRLTRPTLKHTRNPEIILQSPVESGVLFETPALESGSPAHEPQLQQITNGRVDRPGGVQLSLPSSTLNSILRYRENHNAYLRLVSHEAVGSFNPWAIADSLAEELMTEALADVAAEFQDVCEEYAEAVFTSEFLRPIQSPPSSVRTASV